MPSCRPLRMREVPACFLGRTPAMPSMSRQVVVSRPTRAQCRANSEIMDSSKALSPCSRGERVHEVRHFQLTFAEEGGEDVLLVDEVLVDQASAGAGSFGDSADRERGVASFVQKRDRRVESSASTHLRRRRRSTCCWYCSFDHRSRGGRHPQFTSNTVRCRAPSRIRCDSDHRMNIVRNRMNIVHSGVTVWRRPHRGQCKVLDTLRSA